MCLYRHNLFRRQFVYLLTYLRPHRFTACFRKYAARSGWQYACMRVCLEFEQRSTANMRTHLLFPPSACEQTAARTLGYTQASWDDESGREVQPWSAIKYWDQLATDEQTAAEILGFESTTWKRWTGASGYPRAWADLATCSEAGEDVSIASSECHSCDHSKYNPKLLYLIYTYVGTCFCG